MGNRAVITMTERDDSPAIYLHWNGGKASIEGFLMAARKFAKVRPVTPQGQLVCGPYLNEEDFMDHLAEMIGKYFFGTKVNKLHVYREPYGRTDRDNGDNGTYVINGLMEIADRRYVREGYAEEIDEDKTLGIAIQIGEKMVEESNRKTALAAGAVRAAKRRAAVRGRKL